MQARAVNEPLPTERAAGNPAQGASSNYGGRLIGGENVGRGQLSLPFPR
jgi:hypothetical protein